MQANTYSFERVVTLIAGYYFSSGHSILLCAYKLRAIFVCDVLLRLSARIKVSCLLILVYFNRVFHLSTLLLNGGRQDVQLLVQERVNTQSPVDDNR